MITANQIKDKVAQRYGFSTWYHIPVGQRQELVNECINEALNEQLNKPLVMQASGSDGAEGAVRCQSGWVASHVRGMWVALRGSGLQIGALAMRHNGRCYMTGDY